MEAAFTLQQARRQFLGNPSERTIQRWTKVGLKVDGGRVRLVTFREGGRVYVKQSEIERFRAVLNNYVFASPEEVAVFRTPLTI